MDSIRILSWWLSRQLLWWKLRIPLQLNHRPGRMKLVRSRVRHFSICLLVWGKHLSLRTLLPETVPPPPPEKEKYAGSYQCNPC